MFDPKPKTTDDLKDIISASLQEISKREKEELVTCYYVKPYSCSGTWFKKLDDAVKELTDLIGDFTNMGMNLSIKEIDVPESDYNLRPDIWYEG